MQPFAVIRRSCWSRLLQQSHQQSTFLSAQPSPASRQPALLTKAGATAVAAATATAGTAAAKAGGTGTGTGQRTFLSGATRRMVAPPHRHIADGSPSVHRLAGIAGHLNASSAALPVSLPSSSSYTTTQHRCALHTTTSAQSSSPAMSSQPDHPTLLIPGPIEFDDAVLQSMSHYR